MTNNIVDISALGKTHVLSRATRRCARYWPVVYSKLLCMDWYWTDADGRHPLSPIPVPYGATDGTSLFLNPTGVDTLSSEGVSAGVDAVGYVAFLLVHEGAHGILNHGWRLSKMADKEAANKAADYKVNEMVHQRNVESGTVKFPLPKWCLFDLKMSEPHSTEQLYQYIRKNPPPPQPKAQPQHDPDKDSNDESDDTDSDSSGPDGDGNDGGTGDGSPDPRNGDPDQHSVHADGTGVPDRDSSSGADSPGMGGGTQGVEEKNLPGDGSADTFKPRVVAEGDETQVQAEHEAESDAQETNDRLMTVDALDNNACGNNGEASERLAKERDPVQEQDWVSYATQFIDTRCEHGWLRPFNAPFYCSTGTVSPGREGRKVGDIVLVVDSSASIGAEAWRRFMSLAQYTLDEVKPDNLHLISVSHRVVDSTVLQYGDTVPDKLKGGGGTSFKVAFDHIEETHHDNPLLLIYFTDGQCNDHKDMAPPPYPVLWLSYQRAESHFPWGEFAEIKLK